VTPAARWLRERLPDAPPALRDTMRDALGEDAGAPVPDALADAALRLYARLEHGTGARAEALPLLAADALLTHAIEAQVAADPAGLDALAARIGGAGALGRLAGA